MLGILPINKPSGITSFQVIRQLKKMTGISKMGHLGTLDPMATGVLPILLNESTVFFDVLLTCKKIYKMTMQLGIATDTDDKEGQITQIQKNHKMTLNEILKKTALLTGKISQVPPQISALKVGGRRAYEIARTGVNVELKAREVTVYSWRNVIYDPDLAIISAEISCGSGTYIRALARDLASMLGTVAHLTSLERLETGNISFKQTYSLENMQENWLSRIISMDKVLTFLDDLYWKGSIDALKNGVPVNPDVCDYPDEDGFYKLWYEGQIVALLFYEKGNLQYRKNFAHLYF